MTWNYRLIQHKVDTDEEYYAIHEVYYDENGQHDAVTLEPVSVIGDTEEEAKRAYELMAEAFMQKMLNYELDFPQHEQVQP